MIVALCDICMQIIGRQTEPQSYTADVNGKTLAVQVSALVEGENIHICKLCGISVMAEVLSRSQYEGRS